MIRIKPEKFFSELIIGFTFPLLIGLLSVIMWFYFDGIERRAIFYVIAGFAAGLLIDLLYLRRWIDHRLKLPVYFVAFIYIVYNILVFGFFMGFPVFNAFLGIFAGYYFGNRICHKKVPPEGQAAIINRVLMFTGLVMTFFCIASGFLAFTGEGAGVEIKGLLGLGFDITKPMVWAIVIIGGFLLILLQVLLTRITMIKTIKNNTCR
ncbi:MAG: hypothetical protein PHT46_05225 [Candidatus Marinimicrobia bacterium]|jgi:hypothetical protein|nr:hypothetical protein [Candidatus Neomarinimicrobiota bacterium]MDX9778146.1 hypothetical protein [bacterium]